jgi:hypothetical protein
MEIPQHGWVSRWFSKANTLLVLALALLFCAGLLSILYLLGPAPVSTVAVFLAFFGGTLVVIAVAAWTLNWTVNWAWNKPGDKTQNRFRRAFFTVAFSFMAVRIFFYHYRPPNIWNVPLGSVTLSDLAANAAWLFGLIVFGWTAFRSFLKLVAKPDDVAISPDHDSDAPRDPLE